MTDTCTGILNWVSSQECRLRQYDNGIVVNSNDPLVPQQLVEEHALREGMRIEATVEHRRPRRRSGKPRGPSRTVIESLVHVDGHTLLQGHLE